MKPEYVILSVAAMIMLTVLAVFVPGAAAFFGTLIFLGVLMATF